MNKKYIKQPLKGITVTDSAVGTRTPNILMGEHAGEYVRGDMMDANATMQAVETAIEEVGEPFVRKNNSSIDRVRRVINFANSLDLTSQTNSDNKLSAIDAAKNAAHKILEAMNAPATTADATNQYLDDQIQALIDEYAETLHMYTGKGAIDTQGENWNNPKPTNVVTINKYGLNVLEIMMFAELAGLGGEDIYSKIGGIYFQDDTMITAEKQISTAAQYGMVMFAGEKAHIRGTKEYSDGSLDLDNSFISGIELVDLGGNDLGTKKDGIRFLGPIASSIIQNPNSDHTEIVSASGSTVHLPNILDDTVISGGVGDYMTNWMYHGAIKLKSDKWGTYINLYSGSYGSTYIRQDDKQDHEDDWNLQIRASHTDSSNPDDWYWLSPLKCEKCNSSWLFASGGMARIGSLNFKNEYESSCGTFYPTVAPLVNKAFVDREFNLESKKFAVPNAYLRSVKSLSPIAEIEYKGTIYTLNMDKAIELGLFVNASASSAVSEEVASDEVNTKTTVVV